MSTEWVYTETDANLQLMSEKLRVSEITARVLANRGIRTLNTAITYLNPAMKYTHDAALLTDMSKAVSIVHEAIAERKKITVCGDYDVDGVMGTTLLQKAIRSIGGITSSYIPDREEEGYGLNTGIIENLARNETKLIITCDNGIQAIEEIKYARELGMDVVVIDHHEPGYTEDGADILPEANAVIDPKRSDCAYPFKHLCAAALSYKFAQKLLENLPEEWGALDNELLIFAGFATICDIMPLYGENRIIVVQALAAMNRGCENTGLAALINNRGLTDKRIGVYEIGFILGPCINAAGRLENADIAMFLLGLGSSLSEKSSAANAAEKLADLNEDRKQMTVEATERLLITAREAQMRGDKVFVLYDGETPESIAGIVAGRVKEAAHHPVIVLTPANADGMIKGSARSIKGYNMFKALFANKDLLERFGGHEMAAGLTIRREHLETLRERLNGNCALTEADFTKRLYIDCELQLIHIVMDLANELGRLAPFGSGNYEPVFTALGVHCDAPSRIGSDKKTLRFMFTDGEQRVKGIAFGMYDEFYAELVAALGTEEADAWAEGVKKPELILDIAFNIEVNEYNGFSSLQLKLCGVKNITANR